jgi:hypothetical protein
MSCLTKGSNTARAAAVPTIHFIRTIPAALFSDSHRLQDTIAIKRGPVGCNCVLSIINEAISIAEDGEIGGEDSTSSNARQ